MGEGVKVPELGGCLWEKELKGENAIAPWALVCVLLIPQVALYHLGTGTNSRGLCSMGRGWENTLMETWVPRLHKAFP